MSRGTKCFRTLCDYQEFIPRKFSRVSFEETVLLMMYRSAVDVVNFYSPSVPEVDIEISTCHLESFEGIHDPFKLLSAVDKFFARLGENQLPSLMPW